MVTDAQVRRLREKRMSGKTLAAAAAGMSERTAGCWQHGGLPSTAKAPRSWGTREDAFAAVWQAEVVPQLVADTDGRPQVLTLFKALCRRHPGRFQGLGVAVRIEDFKDFGTTTNGLSLPRVSRNRAGVRSVGCHFGCQFGPVDVTEVLSDQRLSAFISRGLIPACREETVRRQGAFRRSSSASRVRQRGGSSRPRTGHGLRARRSNLWNGANENGYAETMLAKSEIQKEALDLPAQERIELVVELWDSLAPGQISVPDWQRDLIRDRLAALEDLLPEERSVPWGAVRKRIFSDKT